MPDQPQFLTRQDMIDALSYPIAVAAIEEVLRAGFDPADDPHRVPVDLANGQFLIMPSSGRSVAGVKVVTVAPGNPAFDLPRIQATYLLYDAETLSLAAVLDGTVLTTLRTPAVSIAAAKTALNRYEHAVQVVVFGAGPQARGHADAIGQCTTADIAGVTFVVRDPARASLTLAADERIISVDDGTLEPLLREAAIVVCATSARSPLFDSALLRDDATVIAVGSHEPDSREVDSAFLGRAQVVVEDVGAALREAGDVVLAIGESAISEDQLILMADVINQRIRLDLTRPVLFKGTGMPWQDLAVADTAFRSR